MEKDGMKEILDIVEEKLSGLDQITRREALKALLKSSAFLAILTGGGSVMLAPALAGAAERKFISIEALTTPARDRMFGLTRAMLLDGLEGFLAEWIRGRGIAGGVIFDPTGPFDPTDPTTGASGCALYCPEVSACAIYCPEAQCTDYDCGDFICGEFGCGEHDCRDDGCQEMGCGDHGCSPGDYCIGEFCPYDDRDDVVEKPRFLPKKFLDRYGDHPFVRELLELFGKNIETEIEDMIRNRTTLRGRGLIGPGAPPPSTRSLDDMLRDMPGRRIQQMPRQPVVQPPSTPIAPTTTTPPPATAPPTAPPATAPPTSPTPVGPRPVITPGTTPTTPVGPTPITPRPIP